VDDQGTPEDVLEADERVAQSQVYGITDPGVASKYGYLPAPSGNTEEVSHRKGLEIHASASPK
jgi:hypothetical protein